MIDFFIELFNQYSKYDAIDIYLEIVAVIFGFLSVLYSKNNNIFIINQEVGRGDIESGESNARERANK